MSEDPGPAAPSTFADVLAARLSRRELLGGGAALAVLFALPGCAATRSGGTAPTLTFTAIAPSGEDALRVPPEYEATVLYRWGDPVGAPGSSGVSLRRLEQRRRASPASRHAPRRHAFLPAAVRLGQLHPRPPRDQPRVPRRGPPLSGRLGSWSAEKVLKAQHAVGVSVVEVTLESGAWRVVRPSRQARRITARTPCRISGPAAGHALVRTAADPQGLRCSARTTAAPTAGRRGGRI